MPSPRSARPHSKVAERADRAFRSFDGLKLAGETRGEPTAPPVILLHGGGQTRHAWDATAQALADAGFCAIAIDQRGHGESDWSEASRYGLNAFAQDLVAVAKSLSERPAVVGASLGGLAGLLAEGSATEPLLSALVLVDIAPRLELPGVSRIVGFMTAHPNGFASLEEAAEAVSAYLPHRPRPNDLGGLAKNLRTGKDGRYRWHWDPAFLSGDCNINPAEFTDRMLGCSKRLSIPTLLVRGGLSDVLSEEACREFLSLVPHAEFVDVANAAHMVAGDRNDRFTQAVLPFPDVCARDEPGHSAGERGPMKEDDARRFDPRAARTIHRGGARKRGSGRTGLRR